MNYNISNGVPAFWDDDEDSEANFVQVSEFELTREEYLKGAIEKYWD